MMKYMIGNNMRSNVVQKKAGFTVLYSLLVISLLISISLGIFDIALRDFALAQSSAESHVAFYAADAGMECALYYDLKFRGGSLAFATSSANPQVALSPQFSYVCGIPLNTGVQPIAAHIYDAGSDIAVTSFTIYLSKAANSAIADPFGPCSIVTVTKSEEGTVTLIDSRGYNICVNSTATTKRVERGLRASY